MITLQTVTTTLLAMVALLADVTLRVIMIHIVTTRLAGLLMAVLLLLVIAAVT